MVGTPVSAIVRRTLLLLGLCVLNCAAGEAAPPAEPTPAPAVEGEEGAASSESEDEVHALLAKRDREKGAQRFGKDPAFLVFPRPLDRNEKAKEMLTPEVAAMTEKALAFLARTQDADGGWSDKQYPSNTGVASLACLAMMAEGSQPRVGRFGKHIDRGMEFLLKNVQSSGVIAGKGSNPYGPMYEHAFSTLALLLAQGDMPWRPETRDAVAKAIQAIGKAQHLDGGWRYGFTREGSSDLSVTANVIWVLRMAKKSGFSVSAEAIAKGVKYVETCSRPDGTFRYRQFGLHAGPSLGGIGIIAMAGNGALDHDLIPAARDRIDYDYRRYTIDDLRQREYFVYQCFYASLAMYSVGDKYWLPFYPKAVKVLAALQKPDGEFTDDFGNSVYTTAMAAIVLQAPMGYMPIYER
ncbi:MAG: terpene cyclase/mutase family protein [Planctomycetes bacterium]|nr:terpene cyclase/mutase family protein [Planctomycetota bacterium]